MFGLIGLVIFVLDVIALIDILKGSGPVTKQLLWILLVLLFPVIGMLIYFLFGKNK